MINVRSTFMEGEMKKIALFVAAVCFVFAGAASAGELQVGMKATDFSFEDSEGNTFTMDSWAGKVLMVNYVDPDESDLNEVFTDAVKAAKDKRKILKEETYKGIGIADCAATWKPNFAIRAIAGNKAKKYNTTILFDYEAVLRDAWGLQKDTSNIVILDKERVCRAIVKGKVAQDQMEPLIQLMAELQK